MKRVGVSFRLLDKAPPYENAVRLAGLDPVRVTPDAPVPLDGLDGLVLTGGTDIDPALFGEEREPHTDDPDRERDRLEMELLTHALDRDLPVLAICRGMQLFNVFHSGTLIQHLEHSKRHSVREKPPHEDVHSVRICPGTRAAAIYRDANYGVNSRHHQGVDRVGKDLLVSGVSDDGLVEILERPDRRFAIGVQWHPEDRVEHCPADRRLFEAFAEAVGA